VDLDHGEGVRETVLVDLEWVVAVAGAWMGWCQPTTAEAAAVAEAVEAGQVAVVVQEEGLAVPPEARERHVVGVAGEGAGVGVGVGVVSEVVAEVVEVDAI